MSDSANCPFCDLWFSPDVGHPVDPTCPLSTYVFTLSQWNMRPPKKEVGHLPKSTQDEVEWLRALVRELIARPPMLQVIEPSKE